MLLGVGGVTLCLWCGVLPCSCLQRCPTHFLRSPLVHLATQYGLAATTLHHRDANASLMMFFRELMACVKVVRGRGPRSKLL